MSSPSSVISPSTRARGDGVVHPVERAQEGRLAAARRADEGGHLVLVDVDRHVVDRLLRAVEDVDVRARSSWAGGAVTSGSRIGCGGRWRAPFIASRKTSSTMIAAEVFSTKPRLTSSDHRKICTGSTVAGSVQPVGRRGDEGAHADHQQRRGLAQRARHADDRAGQDAGQRERQDVVEHDLHRRRADRRARRRGSTAAPP